MDGDTDYREGLNSITWDESRREEFQGVVYDSAQRAFCRGEVKENTPCHLVMYLIIS